MCRAGDGYSKRTHQPLKRRVNDNNRIFKDGRAGSRGSTQQAASRKPVGTEYLMEVATWDLDPNARCMGEDRHPAAPCYTLLHPAGGYHDGCGHAFPHQPPRKTVFISFRFRPPRRYHSCSRLAQFHSSQSQSSEPARRTFFPFFPVPLAPGNSWSIARLGVFRHKPIACASRVPLLTQLPPPPAKRLH